MSEMQTLEDLQKKTLKELYEYARKYKIKYYSQMNKKELSLAVIRAQAEESSFVRSDSTYMTTRQKTMKSSFRKARTSGPRRSTRRRFPIWQRSSRQ